MGRPLTQSREVEKGTNDAFDDIAQFRRAPSNDQCHPLAIMAGLGFFVAR
jgi:hypothetical protein